MRPTTDWTRGAMTSDLFALCVDAIDPLRLGRFWSGLLGWEITIGSGEVITLLPSDHTGFRLRFRESQIEKANQNHMHFDLTSTSLENQQQSVATALDLGARRIDVGQLPGERHVVLADPEGNEFCVIEPGNNFLADCGFVGALACDGSQEVGHFWSEALGWPLVWDQDQETAIRSPEGGPKITWGGPPYMPEAKRRMRFELVPSSGSNQQTEVARLTLLGATRVDGDRRHVDSVSLADPDGAEFLVLSTRET